MPSTKSSQQQSFDACERFFSVHELVSLFLHQAPTLTLVNCQRVCTLWKSIIDRSKTLQENLFLAPPPAYFKEDQEEVTSIAPGPSPSDSLLSGETSPESKPARPIPRLNPVLWERFNRILATTFTSEHVLQSDICTYDDLATLPWARDGQTLTAQARQAFARKEASWRKMQIAHPPIRRLDWWHYWKEVADTPESGHGFEYYSGNVTLGLLWDLVEIRLKVGCTGEVAYFPGGCAPAQDPTASESEKRESAYQHGNLPSTMPRVKIQTWQKWQRNPGPAFQPRRHGLREMLLGRHGPKGWEWLRLECRMGMGEGVKRWSKADQPWRSKLNGEISTCLQRLE